MSSNEWNSMTLGQFIELQRGHDLTNEERVEGDVPVFGAAGHNGFHNCVKAKGPGVIVGRSGGSFGKVHLSQMDFWPHNTALYVKKFKGNDPYFVYYFLRRLDFSSFNSGSAQPSLNRNFINPIKIKVPFPNQQKQIAKVLSDLDSKIDLNNRINAELESMAKLIYDYWFVQFEFPIEAALAAKMGDPSLEGKPYKSSGGKMVWNEELKREIPEGWEVKELHELLLVFTKGLTTKYVEKSELINLNQKVNKGFQLDRQYFKYLDTSIEVPIEKYARTKDILINSLGQGTLGRIHFYREPNNNIVVDQHLFILRADVDLTTSSYLYHTLGSDSYLKAIERQITGSTGMQMLNGSNLKCLKLIRPNIDVSKRFEEIVFKNYEKISINDQENQKLAELRDWLLPMLMNGQVKVNAEKGYEEVDGELGMVAENKARYD